MPIETAAARWTANDVPSQDGRVAVVTGANTGLGFETARVLAEHGAHVVLAVRDVDKGQQAARASPAGRRSAVQHLDLTSLDSVRAAAADLRATHPRIDLLINNAGVMYTPRQTTRGRLRPAVRHQPPRPLRAHRAAAGPDAARARLPGGDGQQRRPPHPGRHPLRRPAVGALVQPGRRLRAVQAGQPDVHLRAAAPARSRTAPRSPSPRTPGVSNTELARRTCPARCARPLRLTHAPDHPDRRHGRAAHPARRHRPGRRSAASTTAPTARARTRGTPRWSPPARSRYDTSHPAAAVDGLRGAHRRHVPRLTHSGESRAGTESLPKATLTEPSSAGSIDGCSPHTRGRVGLWRPVIAAGVRR